jgi:hypothetical protein
MSNKLKLSPWFGVNEHPKRKGWYQAKGFNLCQGFIRCSTKNCVWRYWNGNNWEWKSSDEFLGIKKGDMQRAVLEYPDKWRGILK